MLLGDDKFDTVRLVRISNTLIGPNSYGGMKSPGHENFARFTNRLVVRLSTRNSAETDASPADQ